MWVQPWSKDNVIAVRGAIGRSYPCTAICGRAMIAADSPLRAVSDGENQMPNACSLGTFWSWALQPAFVLATTIEQRTSALEARSTAYTQVSTLPNFQSFRCHKAIPTLTLSPDKTEEVHVATLKVTSLCIEGAYQGIVGLRT